MYSLNKNYHVKFRSKRFICWFLLVLSQTIQAQQPDINSYHKNLQNSATSEEKWDALERLSRYFLTTGNFDSSMLYAQQMLTIAQRLRSDKLAGLSYNTIANAFLARSDHHLALEYYLRAVNLDRNRPALYNSNIGGVYSSIGNNTEALKYLKKAQASFIPSDTSGATFGQKTWTYVYMCKAFNELHQPDSALYYGQLSLAAYRRSPESFIYPGILHQLGLTHQQLGEVELAEAYFKKAIVFSDSTDNLLFISIASKDYAKLLIKQDNYTQAKYISKQGLDAALISNHKDGIADGAEMLRKIYNHLQQKDSAYYYADMQIVYEDSILNQQRVNEIQNITFTKQLQDNEEEVKAEQAKQERQQNIQYALIAITLVTFLILYFLLSRSIVVNARMIEFLGVLALLIVFEFINLLIHPFLGRITHHSPVLMLLAMVCIAALLVPAHHYIEKWVTHKLVEKNKAIRIAAAKKTIENLEGTPTTKV